MRVAYENVTFSYGEYPALHRVSFEIESGSTTLIVGRNGSGKSTLLKLMNGILKPSHGKVIIGQTDTREKKVSELSRSCALCFQNPDDQLFADTVSKELNFGIKNIGTDGNLLDLVVTTLGLTPLLNSNPYSLSYAMRRLVAIGSVAAMNTPILALDEPTAGLSFKEKEKVSSLLQNLQNRGKTLFVVSHDLNFALPMCKNFLLLDRGTVGFFGNKDEFFSKNDIRRVMRSSGMTFPIYPRMAKALGLKRPAFTCNELLAALKADIAFESDSR
ncbi:MAG: energy-coupling factor ABC transporter ATP-binding protein [Candidatus Kryptoniota bacterium]